MRNPVKLSTFAPFALAAAMFGTPAEANVAIEPPVAETETVETENGADKNFDIGIVVAMCNTFNQSILHLHQTITSDEPLMIPQDAADDIGSVFQQFLEKIVEAYTTTSETTTDRDKIRAAVEKKTKELSPHYQKAIGLFLMLRSPELFNKVKKIGVMDTEIEFTNEGCQKLEVGI